MAIRVRVKNVQSIKDAEIVIDGLTVVTGTNNSGKTALMRAIQGVFTNPPAGPLLRWGEAFLSVEIRFEDGTTVLWEKGWEKPDQKGMAINRYKLNGQDIPLAGRGAPAEIAALGVREIQAGTDVMWPQLAQQFDGVLFLVNRPGSATAEALSDVEKVGALTNALRDSERDRRTAEGELKLRRQDVTAGKERVRKFDGLHQVRKDTDELQQRFKKANLLGEEASQARKALEDLRSAAARLEPLKGFALQAPEVETVRQLYAGWTQASRLALLLREARQRTDSLKGFSVSSPEVGAGQTLLKDFVEARGLLERLVKARSSVTLLVAFSQELPSTGDLAQRLGALRELQVLARRRTLLKGRVDQLKFSEPSLGDPDRAARLSEVLRQVVGLRERLSAARGLLLKEAEAARGAEVALEDARTEVAQLLEDRGVCPTCQTPYSSEHSHLGAS